MTTRLRIQCGAFVLLAVLYVVFFTDWLRPAPIEIASQVRLSMHPPRFGLPVRQEHPASPGQTNHLVRKQRLERIAASQNGALDLAAEGAANVTFSLDAWYRLTRIRVEDIPVDGSKPQIMWELAGKSLPVEALLYGRVPEGMHVVPVGSSAEPLKPAAPYRLIVQAGRRRGTNDFRTVEVRPLE